MFVVTSTVISHWFCYCICRASVFW